MKWNRGMRKVHKKCFMAHMKPDKMLRKHQVIHSAKYRSDQMMFGENGNT